MAAALGFWTKFKSYIWDSDAHLKSPEERALIRKLDFGILIVACLGCLSQIPRVSLQNNLANAYISGMKEDLGINGNEYTYDALCKYPSTMIVQKIRALAFCEIGWGCVDVRSSWGKEFGECNVFRFMVGLFEKCFLPVNFPVILYLLGSWYTKTELAKRAAIFDLSGSVGSATAGYLQAAVYTNLDGHAGLAGWRWLYIICGCMTVPCGLLLFSSFRIAIQQQGVVPLGGRKGLGADRAIRNGKGQPTGKVDLALLKRTFSKWHWYWFVLGYVLYGVFMCSFSGFRIGLIDIFIRVGELQRLGEESSLAGSLINIVCLFLTSNSVGFLSDLTGSRFTWVFVPLAYGLIPNGFVSLGRCCLETESFNFRILASGRQRLQYAVAAWLPIVIFPQVEAPTFRKGFPGTFGLVIAALIVIVIIKLFADRDERRERAALAGAADDEETSTDEKNRRKTEGEGFLGA
ncbi:pantothenate transporter liz1 [Mycena olivaceomarginata]|nr:pantothenate transporter liz1 [Mycena olivaceomarginata]